MIENLGQTMNEDATNQMEQIIKKIVDTRTKEISIIIHKIQSFLKDDTQELTDLEIDDILLQLPIVLYDAMEGQEIVGMQSDMATQLYKQAQSEAYNLARGTISDKNAVADIKTRQQPLEKILFDRSYKIIKQKFEMAIETLNAVKKVQASRQQRYDLGRFSNKF